MARRISCGCCDGPAEDRCCCRNHMDIPNGLRPRVCAAHSETGSGFYIMAALLLCLLLPGAAVAQDRRVYTDADPAGRRDGPAIRVVLAPPVPRPWVSPEILAGLKAREYVAPPTWPDGPSMTVAYTPPGWPLPPTRVPRYPTTTVYVTPWFPVLPAYGSQPYNIRGGRDGHARRR